MVVRTEIILKYDPKHERFLDEVEVISISRRTITINGQEYIQTNQAFTGVSLEREMFIQEVIEKNEEIASAENEKKLLTIEKLKDLAEKAGWAITVKSIKDC